MHYAKIQDTEDAALKTPRMNDVLDCIEQYVEGSEYEKEGRVVWVEMYWHEHEFYTHAYVTRNRDMAVTYEGTASGEQLTTRLVTDALMDALDDKTQAEREGTVEDK